MGTSTSPAQLARKFNRAARELPRTSAVATERTALAAKRAIQAELTRAVGAGHRMSGVGSATTRAAGGARLGVRYELTRRGDRLGEGTAGRSTALVRATGPWQLIEGDNAPHRIIPRGLKPRNRRRAQRAEAQARGRLNSFFGFDVTPFLPPAGRRITPLRLPFGFRMGVNHPGTRGKHPFRKGVRNIDARAEVEFRRGVGSALQAVFGG